LQLLASEACLVQNVAFFLHELLDTFGATHSASQVQAMASTLNSSNNLRTVTYAVDTEEVFVRDQFMGLEL
jgi:hypothetical protein